jgi:hypothetical protein
MPTKKRSAKLLKAKISGPATGPNQGANGPFQDQEIVIERPPDQMKSENPASKAIQSSSDSESDDVDMESDSDDETPPPRNAVRSAADDLVNVYHLVLNEKQTRRRQRADEADKKAKQNAVEVSADSKQVDEGQVERQAEVGQVDQTSSEPKQINEVQIVKKKYEVVIVGTLRFMPPIEIAEEVDALTARRIFRRVNGKMEPTTAVVLSFDEEPPSTVYIDHERFRTRPYVRQAVRCHNCQGFNHRQAGCRNSPRCSRCGRRHATGDCKLDTDQPLRCANCRGDHSAASPECPAFLNVKKAWKKVAMEAISYADAIKSVSKTDRPDAARSRRDDDNTMSRRADLIGAPDQSTQRSNWAEKVCFPKHKPAMVSMETQTEPETIEVQTATTSEVECQTMPERKEKKTQPFKDTESQTVEVEITMNQDDKFISTTYLFAIAMLVKHANESLKQDVEYKQLQARYDQTILMMSERRYPIAPSLTALAKAKHQTRQTASKK